jgi:hypothetical protein
MNHPGHIVFFENERVVSVARAASVPESARFAPSASGPVPVVKVVASRAGAQRFIREYGPEGQLLRSTVQLQ